MTKKTSITNTTVSSNIKYIALKYLFATEFNARKYNVNSTSFKKGVKKLASTICAQGLLMNLVVFEEHSTAEGQFYGVAAGFRRFLALTELCHSGFITDDYQVKVEVVDKSKALVVSVTENNDRETMHSSDLIHSFSQFVQAGKTPEVIAGMFGYTTRYVLKLLKLADMSTELLKLHAEDQISLDQLIALSICDDHDRQLEIWKNTWHKTPEALRRAAVNNEEEVKGNKLLNFIGQAAYIAAGGVIRQDLFSQDEEGGGYITDPELVRQLACARLSEIAQETATNEGWKWSVGQTNLEKWGDDKKRYDFPVAPRTHDVVLNEERQQQVDALLDAIERVGFEIADLEDAEEEADGEKLQELYDRKDELEDEKQAIYQDATFTDEYKSERGVIAYLDYHGAVVVLRGPMMLADKAKKENKSVNVTPEGHVVEVTQVSAALARSLSCERTLAVAAELTKKPQTALALMVHRLAMRAFGKILHGSPISGVLEVKLEDMMRDAPGSEDSIAVKALNESRVYWESVLPAGWETDFTLLTCFTTEQLIELQAFCVAISLDGSIYQYNKDKESNLMQLENAMHFDIHSYWKPQADNFWKRLKKESMLDQLTQAGVVIQAEEFLALKKGDAAKRAEELISKIQWVPEFM